MPPDRRNISDFEDAIAVAKESFSEQLSILLKLSKEPQKDTDKLQVQLNELHSEAVAYFNIFGRSIVEYGLEHYKADENVLNSKIDDSVNMSNTIVKYWKLLYSFRDKYSLIIPTPSRRAYSSIQLLLKTYEPTEAEAQEQTFKANKLPITGFTSNKIHIGMTKKQQITYGIIAGTVLLLILLTLSVVIECPTQSQSRIFSVVLALAAAAFGAAIPGFLNLTYRKTITAGGALAIFVIVFFMKPAQLEDFASCQKFLSGTVYYGGEPAAATEVRLLKQNQSVTTGNFGNFNLPVDFTGMEDVLKVQLVKEDIKLSKIMEFPKADLQESLDIKIMKHCANCTLKDSTQLVQKTLKECSADEAYIDGLIKTFTDEGNQLKLTVDCKKETS